MNNLIKLMCIGVMSLGMAASCSSFDYDIRGVCDEGG